MVVLTKLQLIRDCPVIQSCLSFHFSGHQNCVANSAICFFRTALACSKYYIPVYILQLALIGAKNLNKGTLQGVFFRYLRSVLYGGTFPVIANSTVCLYRAIFGKINILTFVILCIMVGANIFIESIQNRRINAYMISTIALEVLINELESYKLITRSPLRDTLKFMAMNGLVMYFLARRKLKSLNFWFYDIKPLAENSGSNQNTSNLNQCTHKESCVAFMKEGFKKYFLIGYGWSIVKILMKSFGDLVKRPKSMLSFFAKAENFKFASALGLYAVIYRYIMCNLLKIDAVRSAQRRALHSAVAGAIAGSTYIIEPNLQFGLTGLVTLLQIFYEQLKEKTLNEKAWAKVPGAELCFMGSVFYLTISYIANTHEFQRANCKFIYDTFSGNIARNYRTSILKNMKRII